MEVLAPRCCGLDIHQNTAVACLMTTEEGQQPVKELRTFRAMTVALLA
jgi:transposase